MGEERSLFEVFWWGAIALWMGEGDRFLGCFGGVRSLLVVWNGGGRSLWDGRERSLFGVFWLGKCITKRLR